MPKPNDEQTLELNWTKIIAWVMSTLFTLLLALVIFVFKGYAGKMDSIDGKVDDVVVAIAVLQTQNTSTAIQISEIKESIKEVKVDIKELRKP